MASSVLPQRRYQCNVLAQYRLGQRGRTSLIIRTENPERWRCRIDGATGLKQMSMPSTEIRKSGFYPADKVDGITE